MAGVTVKVTGLAELRRALKVAEKYEPAYIKECMKGISDQLVPKMQAELRSQIVDPARSTGALESSIKSFGLISGAGVVMGTPKRTAYAGWWEYGGPSRTSSRPPNRKFIKKGRAIMPVVAESREEIFKATEEVIDRLSNIIMTR